MQDLARQDNLLTSPGEVDPNESLGDLAGFSYARKAAGVSILKPAYAQASFFPLNHTTITVSKKVVIGKGFNPVRASEFNLLKWH